MLRRLLQHASSAERAFLRHALVAIDADGAAMRDFVDCASLALPEDVGTTFALEVVHLVVASIGAGDDPMLRGAQARFLRSTFDTAATPANVAAAWQHAVAIHLLPEAAATAVRDVDRRVFWDQNLRLAMTETAAMQRRLGQFRERVQVFFERNADPPLRAGCEDILRVERHALLLKSAAGRVADLVQRSSSRKLEVDDAPRLSFETARRWRKRHALLVDARDPVDTRMVHFSLEGAPRFVLDALDRSHRKNLGGRELWNLYFVQGDASPSSRAFGAESARGAMQYLSMMSRVAELYDPARHAAPDMAISIIQDFFQS